MRMAFFFDQSRCMNCHACNVACKDFNGINPGKVRYRDNFTNEMINEPGKFFPLSMSCNHCENPSCVTACGARAITKRADGIVVVDRDKCRDLKTCIPACPFDKPKIADDAQEPEKEDSWLVRHPVQKCTMCADRIDKGETPICVKSCPARALDVGDYDELLRRNPGAEQISRAKYPYAYIGTNDDTNPSFLIKPRKKLDITGNI
jgi:anaerobic dimethyl sulfoxide reductase subunit B (iron-sulfur subunit)